jgi:hypothetical protein
MFYLYLISVVPDGPIKVGVSNDIKRRMSCLQASFPFKLILIKKWNVSGDALFKVESIAHYKLSEHRVQGEWFSCGIDFAINLIEEIIKKTNGGKDVSFYDKEKPLIKSLSAQVAGKASAKKRIAVSKKGAAKIADRWPQPSVDWPTHVLLKEAGLSYNTAKAHLGRRPIEQANHEAAKKRKERRNAKAN